MRLRIIGISLAALCLGACRGTEVTGPDIVVRSNPPTDNKIYLSPFSIDPSAQLMGLNLNYSLGTMVWAPIGVAPVVDVTSETPLLKIVNVTLQTVALNLATCSPFCDKQPWSIMVTIRAEGVFEGKKLILTPRNNPSGATYILLSSTAKG